MLLSYVKQLVQKHTGKPARRCVITVPIFFSDTDRSALLAAAAIAGLEVLSLVNDGLAVALKYGTDNLQLAKLKGPHRVLLYDMGATATQVTVVEFRGREDASQGMPSSPPSIRVLGTAWDSCLGGATFTNRLVDLLAKGCLPEADLTKDARAMARLRKEATRAKHVLSANKETMVTIEDLAGDYDMAQVVTRGALEEHCADLLERASLPMLTALQRAGNITMGQLDSIEVVGGGWRVPAVHDRLAAASGRQLGKTLNADEAACGGAAILALYLSRRAAASALAETAEFGRREGARLHGGKRLLRLASGLAPPTAAASGAPTVYIQDVVPHDIFILVAAEIVAVIPGGSPLILLGSPGGAHMSTGEGAEEVLGYRVTLPVATAADFQVNFQYSRETSARPFASFAVTGVEVARSSMGPADAAGSHDHEHADATCNGGETCSDETRTMTGTVELHVSVSPDGTLDLYRGVLIYDTGQVEDAASSSASVSAHQDGIAKSASGASSAASLGLELLHKSLVRARSDGARGAQGSEPASGAGMRMRVNGPVELVVSPVHGDRTGASGLVPWGGHGHAKVPMRMSPEDISNGYAALSLLEAREHDVHQRDEKCNLLEVTCLRLRLRCLC